MTPSELLLLLPLALLTASPPTLVSLDVVTDDDCPSECECDRSPANNRTNGAYCGRGGLDDTRLTTLLHALPATLKTLEISAPPWRTPNNFRWNDNINRFGELRQLRLIACGIPALSRVGRLPSLELLDVSRNRLEHTTMASFAGFPQLRILDLSHNRLSSLPTGVFTYLKRLEQLSLANNSIADASSNLLRGLPSLRALTLSNNRIPVRQLNELLSDVPQLEELSIANCAVQPFQNLSLDKLPALRSLDVAANGLKSVPSTEITVLPHLSSLSLSRNRIEEIPPCAFCANNITRLDLSHNKLGLRPKPFDEFSFESAELVELNLGFNHLEDFDSAWLGKRLQHSIQTLGLSGNAVRIPHARLTADMSRLRTLHLAHNMINELPTLLPPEYYHLKMLNLSGNLLTYLPENTDALLPTLTSLDISGNRFSTLSASSVTFINSLDTVFLAGNPWDCSCALQHIQMHMRERYALRRLLDYANARCAQPALLKGQSLLIAHAVNDCAILFGARYGLSQGGELAVLLAALIAASALLSALLFAIYYHRERQYKGSYVTRECSRTPLTMGAGLLPLGRGPSTTLSGALNAPLSCSTTASTSDGDSDIHSPPLPPPPPKAMSALYFGI